MLYGERWGAGCHTPACIFSAYPPFYGLVGCGSSHVAYSLIGC
nr:MAG TPA: hypothetical protein [Caudoviricetes sp.]